MQKTLSSAEISWTGGLNFWRERSLMTEEYSDQINLLAKALNCKSNLLKQHYDQFGISSSLDVRDSARLQEDCKLLETAWKSISIACVSINNLSAFEKGVMELEGRDLATELRETQDFLHETIVHREKLKENKQFARW